MNRSTRHMLQAGFTLVELMVSMVIGLLIVLALVTLLINVNRNNSEMSKTNRQIENGRFAMQLLQSDLVHAGFWGRLGYTMVPKSFPPFPVPTVIPNPCVVTGWDDPYKSSLLGIPVQGFSNGAALSTCNVTGVLASSDVLVVRHANTCNAGAANCEGATDTGPHIQVSSCRSDVSPEARYVIAMAAGVTPSEILAAFPLREKDCLTPATRRKVVSNIYYLATSNNLPTLMRVSLVNGVYSTPQPLIEGIEAFRLEYGLDTLGKNGLPIDTAAIPPNPADGSADTYVSCAPCTLDQLANIVAVKIHILARNLEATPGYTDAKSYQLGAATTIAAANDGFKRHVFSSTVRLVNPSGRREAP